MTIDDRIRTSLAAHSELPPDLPGLYGTVVARGRAVRRRRRVTASVATCVAAVAVAVPFALSGSHVSSPRPQGPTPPPSVSLPPVPVVTVSPPPATTAPAPATSTTRRVDPPERPPAPQHPPALLFPAGPPVSVPLVVSDGSRALLQEDGRQLAVGNYGGGVETAQGVLLQGPSGLLLVTPAHGLVALHGSKIGNGICLGAVSPDGRYLAWGRQDLTGYKPNSGTPRGEYGLYDLKAHRFLDRVGSPREGCPQQWLSDGRLATATGDGGDSGSAIWDPRTGKVTEVTKAHVTVVLPYGHSLDVTLGGEGGCMVPAGSADCLWGTLSPDTTRELNADGLTDRRTGRKDTRLDVLLKTRHLTRVDAVWADDTHLVVVASTHGWSMLWPDHWAWTQVLTCAVPVGGSVSCLESQQVGPVWTDAVGVDAGIPVGPLPTLVRRG